MAQNTLSISPHLQVEERDQAGQVVARYIASGSNGRVDVIVRFESLSMKSEQRLSRQYRFQKIRRAISARY
jgi:hypothetical protein